ncbi:MAG TPA: YihY/virulence factor BrkB family protein [Polyangiaceae bacterium]|jgi:membrane protein
MTVATSPPPDRADCKAPEPERHHGPRVLVDWVKVIWCGMNESRTLGLAAEMSFWLFSALLPLAAVAGLVLARLALSRGDLAASMLGSTPPAVRELVVAQLGQVAKWNGGAVAPVAAVVFVWLASSGVHAVFDALEVQGGAARPWWKKRLLALGTCLGLSVGVAVLALLSTGLGWLFHLAGSSLPHALTFWEGRLFAAVVRVVVGVLIGFGLVAGLYAVGTPRVGRRVIVPGALLAVGLWAASGLAYGLYVRVLGTGNAYQAGLGIIGVTMMSLYLFSLALLIGAELNRAVADRRRGREGATLN